MFAIHYLPNHRFILIFYNDYFKNYIKNVKMIIFY